MSVFKTPLYLLVVIMTLLSGCSTLTPRPYDPLLVDYQSGISPGFERDFGTSSITASRRMILFKLTNKEFLKICAEPPPSVGEQLTRSIEAVLEAGAKLETEKTGSAEFAAKFANNLSTRLIELKKPKGIQFEQDMLYSLCQLHMNSALTADQVEKQYQIISARAERLLMEEIKTGKGVPVTLSEDNLINKSRLLNKDELLVLVTNRLVSLAPQPRGGRGYARWPTGGEGYELLD